MQFGKSVTTALVMSALLVALSGCQKTEAPVEQSVHEDQVEPTRQGTAEHAGQAIDEAAAKVGEKVEQVGEKIQDAAKGDKD